jgi:hypothetical protein
VEHCSAKAPDELATHVAAFDVSYWRSELGEPPPADAPAHHHEIYEARRKARALRLEPLSGEGVLANT